MFVVDCSLFVRLCCKTIAVKNFTKNSSLATIGMEWKPENDISFIEHVKRRPVLWDNKHEHYNNRLLEKDGWNEISSHFGVDVETLKRKWRCLRSQFRRELVRNKRTDTGRVLTKWKHYARLNFLAGVLNHRNSNCGFLPKLEYEEESIHIKPHTPDPLPEQPSDPMEEILTVNYPLDAVNKVEKGNLPTVPSADTPNDSNYYFALSLVGLLNGIPKRRQMSARIAIMTTLNDFAENLHDD